jgi:hypothetical protein
VLIAGDVLCTGFTGGEGKVVEWEERVHAHLMVLELRSGMAGIAFSASAGGGVELVVGGEVAAVGLGSIL